jgi:hypothetical protein
MNLNEVRKLGRRRVTVQNKVQNLQVQLIIFIL